MFPSVNMCVGVLGTNLLLFVFIYAFGLFCPTCLEINVCKVKQSLRQAFFVVVVAKAAVTVVSNLWPEQTNTQGTNSQGNGFFCSK